MNPVQDQEGWVVVFSSRRRQECHERAFVLNAVGLPCLIADGPLMSAVLLVPAAEAERARAELQAWEGENRPRPAARSLPEWHGYGVSGVAAYAVVLLLVFWIQNRQWRGIDWVEAGMLHGAAIRSGEWWRIVTALTLHGDAGHLSANLVFGAFFGAFAGQYLGSGFGWAVIVLAAAAGNLMDVLLLPPVHRALGASTAVFAALGLVAAYIWVTQTRTQVSWARRYGPIIGAVVLLTWIGTGDAKTDTVAHLTGFIWGFVAGAAWGWRPPAVARRPWAQAVAGLAVLGVITTCWWLAVATWRPAWPG